MSSSSSSTYEAPQLPPNHVTIDRLPLYFPTSHKNCAAPTEHFFRCLDENAVMLHPTDNSNPKTAMITCQRELVGYMQCMEKQTKSASKPWWKAW